MLSSLRKIRALCSTEDIKKIKLVLCLTLIIGILEVAGLATIVPFLQLASDASSIESNKVASSFFNFIGVESYQSQIALTGWFVLIFFMLANIFNALSGWVVQKFGWRLLHNISIRLADTYLNLPYDVFIQKETADIVKSTISDVNNLVHNVIIAGCRFFSSIIVSLVIILLLAAIQPKIAGITFLALSVIFLLIFIYRKSYISELGRNQLEHNSQRYITYVDLLHGKSTIQASNSHDYFFNRFERPSSEYSQVQPKLFLNGILPRYIIETLLFSIIILLIIALTKNSQNLNEYVPIISLYALAGYRLIPALNNVYLSATLIASNHHAIHQIYEDFVVRNQNSESSNDSISFEKNIRFENVDFKYDQNSDLIIKDVSFTLEKGQNTAIIGTSGSGKTTIGSLLVGLLKPDTGTIKIDDVERRPNHLHAWINKVGYVPQDVFLFNGTVEENICFGAESDHERLVAASTLAQAHGFITDKLANQYQSVVGDGGIRLSGGQKQRIGLARALYRNPSILILDEATSALDTKTEKLILDAIFQELTDTTIVLIAHRVYSVRTCEKILLLENGELKAEGVFNTLKEESELFRELCTYI